MPEPPGKDKVRPKSPVPITYHEGQDRADREFRVAVSHQIHDRRARRQRLPEKQYRANPGNDAKRQDQVIAEPVLALALFQHILQ